MIYFCREKRVLLLNEIALRKKALLIEDFPNQELIDEFLIKKASVPEKIDIQWKQPQVNEFIVSFNIKLHKFILFILTITRFMLGFHGTIFILGTTICI